MAQKFREEGGIHIWFEPGEWRDCPGQHEKTETGGRVSAKITRGPSLAAQPYPEAQSHAVLPSAFRRQQLGLRLEEKNVVRLQSPKFRWRRFVGLREGIEEADA